MTKRKKDSEPTFGRHTERELGISCERSTITPIETLIRTLTALKKLCPTEITQNRTDQGLLRKYLLLCGRETERCPIRHSILHRPSSNLRLGRASGPGNSPLNLDRRQVIYLKIRGRRAHFMSNFEA